MIGGGCYSEYQNLQVRTGKYLLSVVLGVVKAGTSVVVSRFEVHRFPCVDCMFPPYTAVLRTLGAHYLCCVEYVRCHTECLTHLCYTERMFVCSCTPKADLWSEDTLGHEDVQLDRIPSSPNHPRVIQDFAQRRSQSAPLSITYGSTELVNAEDFFEQLMELGHKQG